MSRATRENLMDAAVRLTASAGARGLTARAIGAEAGVNQALIFYHFDGVEGLLRAAYERATRAMVEDYAAALEKASSFADLYAVGEQLGARSRADGSAALLTHVMAASHHDALLASAVADALGVWRRVVADAVDRVVAAHGLEGTLEVDALARALAASTIGMVTVDALPGAPLGETMRGLDPLPRVADALASRFPRALARRIARVAGRGQSQSTSAAVAPPDRRA
ncbi:helix-turn-helix transcriptional regulator [Phycicoccus endophyticus]|uniref:Helix-turn-helix transcriptional regulator n=1 Tax=Phycicoccus endophyticus TaxID=1690220 RepID=A0A7G9R2Q7_9MICO|nr:helix-turn-helix domain-containing protein [Phycicoccus endophyticus]NHI20349.1 helix-turn-helix transcriptional regulator [Phycicoccus endophyticus]QNN49882.1 helix-turn-helix transcriptional regulator [Phycicoccus endophyticus]GGL29937.1 TetR family transcriptional regulator [Phycicoccus endophyticus]